MRLIYLASKNFWLLLIPLVRGLIALRWDFYAWAEGAWLDILTLLLIGGMAWLRWHCSWYAFSGKALHIKNGVFLKKEFSVPFSSVCAMSAERRFFFRPLRTVNLYLDTNSGTRRKADVQITVYRKDCEVLFKLMRKPLSAEKLRASYRPSMLNLALFSFLFSSTLSGVVLIATLLIESSRIIGNSLLQETLLVAVNDVARILALRLPPLAVGISLLIAAGWLISFFNSLLRHVGFKIRRNGKVIDIQTGYFTRRRYYIHADKINYADLRQNLMTKLFSIMSVYVNCSGYGKAKNEIPVFVPLTTSNQVYGSLKLLLPSLAVPSGGRLRPQWNNLFRFIGMPLIGAGLIPLAARALFSIFPLWHTMILFAAIMSEIPLIWLITVKFVDFFTTGVSLTDKTLCIKYASGYAFHTILIPQNKITKIIVRQNIFQRLSKSCDLLIYSSNEFAKPHRALSLPIHAAYDFLQSTEQIFTNPF